MATRQKTGSENEWLTALGKHIEGLIKERGYASVYDFWLERASDEFSRAGLQYIVAGKRDPRATTLKALAKLLGVRLSVILDFNE